MQKIAMKLNLWICQCKIKIASDKHRLSRQMGKTCIDCHKGIAHKLPELILEQEHLRFEREDIDCVSCHKDMARPVPGDGWGDDR